MISDNAIHYIFLSTTKSKAQDPKRKLDNAIKGFYKKFNGQQNLFLSVADTSATVDQLREAYIQYGVNLFLKDANPNREYVLRAVCQQRSIPADEFNQRLIDQAS